MKKLLIIITVIAILGWTLAIINPARSAYETTYEAPQAPFDHSGCQYPNRLSNPPDGCDNSDPARPECMKFGTEDCDIPTQEVIVEPEPTPIIVETCNQK